MPKVHLEKRKPETIAYIERTGSYDALPFAQDFERLYRWAREHKLRPGMRPLALYLDPPDTPPERLRTRIAITVRGDARPEGGVQVQTLPPMEVATLQRRGPTRMYASTYAALRDWTGRNGYEWDGPSMERYTRMPKQRGGETVVYAKVQVPVRRKRQA